MATWDPIEGETPIDPSHLKDKSIKTREQLNIAEARNILKPIVKYLGAKPSKKLAPFELNWFKQLHEEMFCDVWEYAGEFRQEDLNIGIKWQDIQTELYKLEQDIAYWIENDTYESLELAVRIHIQAVHIHPFPNATEDGLGYLEISSLNEMIIHSLNGPKKRSGLKRASLETHTSQQSRKQIPATYRN